LTVSWEGPEAGLTEVVEREVAKLRGLLEDALEEAEDSARGGRHALTHPREKKGKRVWLRLHPHQRLHDELLHIQPLYALSLYYFA